MQKRGQYPWEGGRHDKAKGIDAVREVSPEMAEDHDKAERQYLPSWSSDRSLSSWDMHGLHCKMYAEAAHHALGAA